MGGALRCEFGVRSCIHASGCRTARLDPASGPPSAVVPSFWFPFRVGGLRRWSRSARRRSSRTGSVRASVVLVSPAPRGAADEYRLWKAINGSFTLLGSTTTGTNMQAGDRLGLKYEGSMVSLWRKPAAGAWAPLLSATGIPLRTTRPSLSMWPRRSPTDSATRPRRPYQVSRRC